MKTPRQYPIHFLPVLLAFLWSASVAPGAAIMNNVSSNFWYPDGYVYAISQTNGVVYIGGDFHYVGPYTGPAAFLDPATGARDDEYPQVNGQILAAVPDGAGGMFIGGDFSMVGEEVRFNLAHILADKTVDTNWNAGAFGRVSTLLLIGETLYVGGSFFSLGGLQRTALGAVSASSGGVTPWNPSPFPPGQINALASIGNAIYVAGAFFSIGGQNRTNLA